MEQDRTVKSERSLEIMDVIALVLLFIGGINWALVGLFNFNLVSAIFSGVPVLERIIYVLVGISAVYMAIVTPMIVRYRQEHPRTTTRTV